MAELKRYEPHTFATVQDVFDRLFDRSLFGPGLFANGTTPHTNRGFPSNLWETDEAYVLELAIPGVNPDDIEMTLSKGSLIIKGHYDSASGTKGTRIWRNLPEGEFEIRLHAAERRLRRRGRGLLGKRHLHGAPAQGGEGEVEAAQDQRRQVSAALPA